MALPLPTGGALAAPGVSGAGVALPLPTGGALPVGTPDAVVPSAAVQGRLSETAETISIAGKELKEAKTDETSRDAVTSQFNALTGELFLKAQPAEENSGGAAATQSGTGLAKPAAKGPEGAVAEVPAAQAAETPAKGSWKQVFKDPERNTAFWRYLKGYAVFLVGFQAYMVGLPYLISAFTKNTLKESHDARLENAEALKALIRQNRSLARVAHWASQAVAYVTIPLFTAKNSDNPKKWLVRSMLIRSGLLLSVVGLFFASGIFSMPVALRHPLRAHRHQLFLPGSRSPWRARPRRGSSATSRSRPRAAQGKLILTFVASIILHHRPRACGPARPGQGLLRQDRGGRRPGLRPLRSRGGRGRAHLRFHQDVRQPGQGR